MLTTLTPLEIQVECAKLQNWKVKNDKVKLQSVGGFSIPH
jgi:hypothetical protein